MLFNKLSRRNFLKTSAGASALALAAPRIALGQDMGQPESLMRDADRVLSFRSWGSVPAEIKETHRFLEQNPDASIEWVNINFAKFRDTLTTEFVGQSGLDATTVPETELSGWADAGFLHAVDDMPGIDEIRANALEGSTTAGKGLDGRQYGIPYTADPFGYIYNRKNLNEAGFSDPPKNMDELRTQMEAIKKAGIQEYPLHLGLKKQPGQMWSIWCLVLGSGGSLFNEENEPLFDGADDTLKNVLEWYVAAVNDWKIVGPDDFGKNWADGRNAMKQGLISGGFLARWGLRFSNVDPDSSVQGQVYLGLVPGLERNDVATVGAFHQIGISANSPNPDLAWDFIRHISGPEADGSYKTLRVRTIAFGGRAAYFPVLNHPDYTAMVQNICNGETDAYEKISEIVMQKQGVKTFWYPEWEDYWMQQVQDALTKKQSVQDALSASADRARRLARG